MSGVYSCHTETTSNLIPDPCNIPGTGGNFMIIFNLIIIIIIINHMIRRMIVSSIILYNNYYYLTMHTESCNRYAFLWLQSLLAIGP